ncbi:MAG TPA: hypothetical protein VMW01_17605 [Williamwhitmania sp.]|nr:hypothetical protein [Williamwhitmania sp.]
MENLVNNLSEMLIHRRKNEYDKMQELDAHADKDLLLIYSGKLMELDFAIKAINDMLAYHKRTQKEMK